MTNPFAPSVPAEQAQPATAPAAPGNPFAAQQQAPAPAANPYAQQAPAAPTGPYGQAPQAYAPPAPAAPQAYAPAAPQHAAPPALDMSRLSAAGAPVVGEGRGASLADMFGRLCLFFPLKEETVPRRPEHITAEQRAAGNVNQQRLTAHVVVLDGGRLGDMTPIAYGGKPYALPPTPHTDTAPLPYLRRGMWINQSRVISQLRGSIPAPGQAPGMVAGRVTKDGPNNSDPWYLIAATDDELGLVRKYLELVQAGQYPHPLG